MGKTYNLGKKELNNFLQECVMKCLKNKDNVNSVVKNTLNEWGVKARPDGKGGYILSLDNDINVNNNVYIDNDENSQDNLINIDTRTNITNQTGTYNIENVKGYDKYILFSTLAELLKKNPNIFTKGDFKQISVSLRELLNKMVDVHSQQNLNQQTVNEKINIQQLKSTPLNQNIVNKQSVDNINIENIILNIWQYCSNAIALIINLKTKPGYKKLISNDFVKISVNYIDKLKKCSKNRLSRDLSQLATIFSGEIKTPKIVYYFIQEETKLMSTILNRRKLKENDLSYYQAILPGTDVEVISLFSFSNFAGTEIIKANAISTSAKPMEELYGQNPPDPDIQRVNITWEGGENLNPEDYFNEGESDGHNFIKLILSHAYEVLTNIKYEPNFIICVPSTAKFNENMIKALAQKFDNCESYEAFMVKNWLEYKMSNEDKQKIEKYLSYRKYQYGKTEYTASVNGFEELVSRAVGITFCRMISSYIEKNKYIMTIINQCSSQKDGVKQSLVKNYVLKLVLQAMCNKNKNFYNFINNNVNIRQNLKQSARKYIKQFSKITNNINEIADQAITTFADYLPQDGKNAVKPLQIDLNYIEWKDTGVQMTSLVPTGRPITTNKNSKLTATDARPLMVSVYIVNRQKYELTKDGERLIQDLQAAPDIPGQLNESESQQVEINNKRILIFDDDIDTGASMKLCVQSMENILEQYKIQSTQMKGLTAFTKLGTQQTENTSN